MKKETKEDKRRKKLQDFYPPPNEDPPPNAGGKSSIYSRVKGSLTPSSSKKKKGKGSAPGQAALSSISRSSSESDRRLAHRTASPKLDIALTRLSKKKGGERFAKFIADALANQEAQRDNITEREGRGRNG